jgi:hypothetical protein
MKPLNNKANRIVVRKLYFDYNRRVLGTPALKWLPSKED